MAKLTWYAPDGSWGISGAELSSLPPALYGAVYKLMQYEHAGARGLAPDGAGPCDLCRARIPGRKCEFAYRCPAGPKSEEAAGRGK